MSMQIDNAKLKKTLDRLDQSICELFRGRMGNKEENKEDPMHGGNQDPFDARVEQYTEEARQDGEKLVLAMVADPYGMLGEIFQISLNNTECDAGMLLKSRVTRLIEERSLVNETEPTPEEYKKSIWERKQCD